MSMLLMGCGSATDGSDPTTSFTWGSDFALWGTDYAVWE